MRGCGRTFLDHLQALYLPWSLPVPQAPGSPTAQQGERRCPSGVDHLTAGGNRSGSDVKSPAYAHSTRTQCQQLNSTTKPTAC